MSTFFGYMQCFLAPPENVKENSEKMTFLMFHDKDILFDSTSIFINRKKTLYEAIRI